jgi:Phage Mu protein F like protein
MAGINAVFGRPFKQQVAAFRLRLGNLAPTAKWTDIWQAEHDRAFMVAGALKADLLADLAAAVDKAISQGTTLETFRKDFREIVARNGWEGYTGSDTAGGRAWRTRVIYKTNLSVSYASGRWAQLMEAGYPFLVYRHGASLEPREQHLAWDGLILPPDHPFWASHAPPNGWGCSCYVLGARSREAARRLGGKPELELPDNWQATDPRTGAPVGIDRGWDYAPGASVAEVINTMATKTVQWEFEIAKAFMADLPDDVRDQFANAFRALPSTADAVRQYAGRVVAQGPQPPVAGQPRVEEYATLGLLTQAQELWFGERLGGSVAGFDFAISRSAVLHVMKKHGDDATERRLGQRAVTTADFALLLQLLADPATAIEDKGDLVMTGQIGPDRVTAIFTRLAKRRMLNLVSMWIGV